MILVGNFNRLLFQCYEKLILLFIYHYFYSVVEMGQQWKKNNEKLKGVVIEDIVKEIKKQLGFMMEKEVMKYCKRVHYYSPNDGGGKEKDEIIRMENQKKVF